MRTDKFYSARRCTVCEFVFTTPRPTQADLADFYSTDYFSADTAFGYDNYAEGLAEANAVRSWEDLRSWVPGVALSPSRLLDIGGATGAFAERASKDGWDSTVCELGESARKRAQDRGLKTVAQLDAAEGRFELITMFHVLEHFIDPLDALKEARAKVAQNGLLVIELPHWRSAGRLVRGAKWAQFKPPEHINFFTAHSLGEALSRSSWEPLETSTVYPYSSENAARAARKLKVGSFAVHASKALLGTAGFGGYLRAVARPAH